MASKVVVVEVETERDSALPGTLQPPSTCSASFNSLSSDILYIITLQLLHGAENQPDLPLCLSQICCSLRTFALGTPTLWSRISFFNPRPKSLSFNEQQPWLQRSGDVPLHIQLKPPRWADRSLGFSIKALGRIMALLLPHIERWASFQLDSPKLGSKGRHLVLDLLRGKAAPELETLSWLVPRDKNQRRYLPPSSMALPKLQNLVLCGNLEGADIPQIGQQWPALRRVELRNIRTWTRVEHLDIAHVLELLARLSSLEDLAITQWQLATTHLRTPIVSVPNLRSLSTSRGSPTWLGLYLNAPALVTAHPRMMLDDHTIHAIAKFPSFPWPHLRSIAVNLDKISNFPALVRVLESLRELTELDLVYYRGRLPVVDLLCSSLPTVSRLSMSGDYIHLSIHARHIAQMRLESARLASLTYLDTTESYSLGDYMWLRGHVPEFVPGKVPTPPEQLPLEPTKRPRRRYRKARTKPRWLGGKLPPSKQTRLARRLALDNETPRESCFTPYERGRRERESK